MKFWLLRPRIDVLNKPRAENPWEPWYDKAFSFVVRAETEEEARKLAQDDAGDEKRDGKTPWLSADFSTCTELNDASKGVPGAVVIIRVYAAA